MHHRAIETRYAGRRFRSRLEARYAVLFDALGLKWEYEREGYELPSGRYLPDFFVHWGASRDARLHQFREVGYWVEIKGQEPTPLELQKLSELTLATGHISYLLAGGPHRPRVWIAGVTTGEVKEWDNPHLHIGWLAFIACCAKVTLTDEQVDAAVAAATGARFEHGERGAAR